MKQWRQVDSEDGKPFPGLLVNDKDNAKILFAGCKEVTARVMDFLNAGLHDGEQPAETPAPAAKPLKEAFREVWQIIDTKTGKASSVTAYSSELNCLYAIVGYLERQIEGGRPDINCVGSRPKLMNAPPAPAADVCDVCGKKWFEDHSGHQYQRVIKPTPQPTERAAAPCEKCHGVKWVSDGNQQDADRYQCDNCLGTSKQPAMKSTEQAEQAGEIDPLRFQAVEASIKHLDEFWKAAYKKGEIDLTISTIIDLTVNTISLLISALGKETPRS